LRAAQRQTPEQQAQDLDLSLDDLAKLALCWMPGPGEETAEAVGLLPDAGR
jgi:hypothetical protein